MNSSHQNIKTEASDISQNSTGLGSSLIEEIHDFLFERNISLEQSDIEEDKKIDQNEVLQMSEPFEGPNLPVLGQGVGIRFFYDDDIIILNECVASRLNLDFPVFLPVENHCLHHILFENIESDEQKTLGLEPKQFVICSKQNIIITSQFLQKLKYVIATNDFITE